SPGVLAPGMMFTVFGTNLSDGTTATGPATSTLLAGTKVLVNGAAVLMIYASPTQINAVAPLDLGALPSVQMQVVVQSGNATLSSAIITLTVGASPGVFTLNG